MGLQLKKRKAEAPMKSMKTLFILLLAVAPAWTQTPNRFTETSGDVSLSAAGTTFTIQQPSVASGGAKQVTLEGATVYCSVACNLTQTYNGTAASTTAVTPVPVPGTPANATASVTTYKNSNVGSGTGVGGILHIPAGQTINICLNTSCGALANVTMGNTDTGTNYNFVISSITGTANITVTHTEK
jgi:hypothetical protein